MITLFQKDLSGKLRSWTIYITGHEKAQELDLLETCSQVDIVVETGLVDGKQVKTVTPITEGLGGKSIYDQARADMETEINKKKKSGYVLDASEAKSKTETATIDKPAKGLLYHPKGKDKGLTIAKSGLGSKCGIQPKLDGWRYRIFTDGIDVIYYTSSGDLAIGFPHISMAVISLFEFFKELYGLDYVLLDGEIYNHELGFQAVQSACGTTKHFTLEKEKLRNQMKFYIFDIVNLKDIYRNRYEALEYFNDGVNIIKVPMYIDNTEDGVINYWFDKFTEQKYEGVIIRNLNSYYEHRKSKQFLKYKPIIDDEFQIIGFEESIQKNTLGAFILMKKDGTRFNCNLKDELGTDKMRKQIWDNKHIYNGKFVTVEFLEYTKDGIPRIPRAKCIRPNKNM